MKYQSAYIMLTNFLQRDINILTIWKKVGFKCCLKRGVDVISLICCGMLFHAFGAVTPKRLAENYNLNAGFVV